VHLDEPELVIRLIEELADPAGGPGQRVRLHVMASVR
jgi:hypothetical protein